MTDDLMQRAARHRHDPNWEGTPSYCIACSFDDGEAFHDVLWPCLVHDLAAALAAEQVARKELQERLRLAEMRVLAFERGNKALDCATPKCSQERTVLLDGPDPAELQGERAVWVAWWCGSCHTIWSNTLKEWVWEQGAALAGEEGR